MTPKQGLNYRAARRNRWRAEGRPFKGFTIHELRRPWAAFRFPTKTVPAIPRELFELITEKGIRLRSMKRRTITRAVTSYEHRQYRKNPVVVDLEVSQ